MKPESRTQSDRRFKRSVVVRMINRLGIVGAIAVFPTATLAQVVADPSLGSTVIPISPNYAIIGGTTVGGRNLFHSFSQFDVPKGAIAAFFNSPTIANIFARVTGGQRSTIEGTILTQGTANLFLINPSGILFGPGAQLSLGGSLVATTANAIQFPGGAVFSPTSAVDSASSLLAVDPSAFLFSQISPRSITNRSTAGLQTVGGSVLLLGGDVILDSGKILSLGGHVELGGLAAPGVVGLNYNANDLSLSFPAAIKRAEVSLLNQSQIGVVDRGGIAIYAQNLKLASGSSLLTGAGTIGSQAGDIHIDATGMIHLSDSSQIGSGLVGGRGGTGNIDISGQTISLTNGSAIGAFSVGQGNAGNVSIRAIDTIDISGRNANGTSSGILSTVASVAGFSGQGKGGNLDLQARTIALRDGAQIGTGNILAQGDAGNIQITVSDSLVATGDASVKTSTSGQGNAGNVVINAGNSVSFDGAGQEGGIGSEVLIGAKGHGGNIEVNTRSLSISNGDFFSSSTFGAGDAGSVRINAQEQVSLNGENSAGTTASGIASGVVQGAIGNGGEIQITTRSLSVTNGARLTSSTFGQGNAGNVIINARDTVSFDGASRQENFVSAAASTVEIGAKGKGGEVVVTTGSLFVTNGARLISSTFGQGDAGNVTINARDTVAFDGTTRSEAAVSAAASTVEIGAKGKGGEVVVTTGSLFVTNGARLTSSTFGRGDAGNIIVNARDIISFDGTSNNGASVSAATSIVANGAIGRGGDINLIAKSFSLNNHARLSAQSFGAGNGGNITANAARIRLRHESDILTVSNFADGGNITLSAKTIVALENSDILAFAPAGKGGNITFQTIAFLSDPLYRSTPPITDRAALSALLTNNKVDVNASGTVSGSISGVPDITFLQNSLTKFSQTLVDPSTLLANSCIIRSRQQNTGSFFITGSGGIPERPGDAPISVFPTGEVRSTVENRGLPGQENPENTRQPLSPVSPARALASAQNRPWRIGDPIVEPQGVYHLPDGQLVMSRECPK